MIYRDKKKHREPVLSLLTNQSVLLNTIFMTQTYDQNLNFTLSLTILSHTKRKKHHLHDALTTNQPKYITNKKIK